MKTISTFITASVLVAASSISFAGDTLHSMPGTACAAYNNNQANQLQRQHVRIFLPTTATSSLWIVCPVQAVAEDQGATVDPAEVYVNVFFDEQVAAGTQVTCLFREFDFDTTHFPGRPTSDSPDATLGLVSTKSLDPPNAEATFEFNLLPDEYVNFQYYTMTCQLAPGTGINSLDFRQR